MSRNTVLTLVNFILFSRIPFANNIARKNTVAKNPWPVNQNQICIEPQLAKCPRKEIVLNLRREEERKEEDGRDKIVGHYSLDDVLGVAAFVSKFSLLRNGDFGAGRRDFNA